MKKQTIVFGGSPGDPPHLDHARLILAITEWDPEAVLYWILCGDRPGQKKYGVADTHRVAMTKLMLQSPALLPYINQGRIVPNYDNVGKDNIPAIDWFEYFKVIHPCADIYHVVGSDLVIRQERFGGKSEIEATWVEGEKLWHDYPFLVIQRKGYEVSQSVLPSQFRIVVNNLQLEGLSSTAVRKAAADGLSFKNMVLPEIYTYIRQNNLYIL